MKFRAILETCPYNVADKITLKCLNLKCLGREVDQMGRVFVQVHQHGWYKLVNTEQREVKKK